MTLRERRAARELRGYLERLYGPQNNLVVEVDGGGLDGIRISLVVDGIAAPRPKGDGRTYSASSIDRYSTGHVALVARLALRFVAIRGVRYTPGGGLAPSDPDDGMDELHAAFGDLFPVGTVEVDVPWQDLLRAGAEVLWADGLIGGATTRQAKTKFASLRWYLSTPQEAEHANINEILDTLEFLSTVVCEECGSPGHHRSGGWHVIRCDDCQSERDRKIRNRRG